jgi:hypothetical protein
MPTVNSLPNGASFGTQFDYSVWGPGTEVTLCNAPWDSMYRDVYWFDSTEETIKYIQVYNKNRSLPTVSIKNLTYCAQNVPVRINVPFSEANTFNYLIVQNSAFPISQKNRATTFFYFIQSIEYIAPETTQLTISLDVWQTYHRLVSFGDAFIERSHMLEYADQKLRFDKFSSTGKWPFFARNNLKVAEGFDLGERHMIYRSWISSLSDDFGEFKNRYDFTAIIISSTNLEGDLGTTGNPSLSAAYGSNVQYNVPNDTGTGASRKGGSAVSGATVYQCPLDKLPAVMKVLSDAPWVAQGILDIYYVPKPAVIVNPARGKAGDAGLGVVSGVVVQKPVKLTEDITSVDHLKDFRDGAMFNERHLTLLERFGKFFTSPYCYYEVSANNGQTITIAPEQLRYHSSIGMRFEYHILPPSPRIVGYVYGLNSAVKTTLWKGDMEYVNEAIVIDNFPHVPVVNDQSMIWYASNAKSIAQSRSAATWGLDKSTRATDTSFDATMRGIRTGNAIMNNNLGAQNLNTALANTAQMAHQQVNSANRAISGIGGAVGTAFSNPISAIGQLGGYVQGQVTSDISTSIDINARNLGNVISQNLTRANQSEQNMLTGTNAAANRDLAKWASQGDYQQQIASINASVRDAEITPPTVSSSIGGDAFNWLINGAIIQTRMRMVSPDIILRQGAFWERYGYAVNTFINKLPSKLRCMDRFTYWKCQNVRVTSSSTPQTYIDTLRGILEKGVTVWHSPVSSGETTASVAEKNSPINWEKTQ